MRGAGELGSAAAALLHRCGFPVVLTERAEPLAVRRRVSFSEAVLAGSALVEGVEARRVEPGRVVEALGTGEFIPLLADPGPERIEALAPAAVVEARMVKRPTPGLRSPGRLVIGLGPGFVAPTDADAVVETQRGPRLGRVIWEGGAQADTGEAAPVLGVVDRVVRAPRAGRFRPERAIGDLVAAGERLGEIGGAAVLAPTDGLLRGLLAEGVHVEAGVKLGDVDPRGHGVDVALVSDKGRAVAAGVLEALLTGLRRLRAGAPE